MSEAVLTLENIVKRYGDFTAVDGVSFDVRQGEIFGFLGPNGAGKTTTLRMILDIIEPTSGRITVLGSNSAIPVRRRIGYLPEERGLYRKMKAAQTIAYFAELRGLSSRDAKAKALSLMEEFGLGEFAKSKNEALSKGMAQKVQLLSTIAHDPELLILDEPFSGLDPINQHTLEELVRRLRDEGKTIIFSTHVMQHAERLCDRFLIMTHGREQFIGNLLEARALFPPRLIIKTADGVSFLDRVPGVLRVSALDAADPAGETEYEIELKNPEVAQDVLRASFDAGVRLSRFEHAGASLHDIFVAIAGPDAESDEPVLQEAAE